MKYTIKGKGGGGKMNQHPCGIAVYDSTIFIDAEVTTVCVGTAVHRGRIVKQCTQNLQRGHPPRV